jgi:hypothetical protein
MASGVLISMPFRRPPLNRQDIDMNNKGGLSTSLTIARIREVFEMAYDTDGKGGLRNWSVHPFACYRSSIYCILSLSLKKSSQ